MTQPSETQERLKQIRERRNALKEKRKDLAWEVKPFDCLCDEACKPFAMNAPRDIDFLLSLIDIRAPVDSQGAELAREAYDYFMGPQACGDFTCACGNAEACGVCEIRQRFERWLGGQPDESPAATQMRTACVETIRALRPSATGAGAFKDAAIKALGAVTLDQVKQK